MKIIKVTYKNFKQHRDLVCDFSGGNVIAIVGPNGNGKSNAMGGIQFAFTGEQPGFSKADLTTWGEKKGSVTVEFEHAGKNWTLTRATSEASATLKNNEDVSISGITAVDSYLKEYMFVDKDIMRQAVFVGQSEVDSILFTDPGVRELAFQRLVGLGDARKLYDGLGNYISSLERPVSYDAVIVTWETEIEKLQALHVTQQASLISTQQKLVQLEQQAMDDQELIGRLQTVQLLMRDLKIAEESHKQATRLLQSYSMVDPIVVPDEVSTEQIAFWRSQASHVYQQIEGTKHALLSVAQLNALGAEKLQLQQALAANDAELEGSSLRSDLSLASASLANAQRGLQELETAKKDLMKIIQGYSQLASGHCPTCGAEIDLSSYQRAQQAAGEIQAQLLTASGLAQQARSHELALSQRVLKLENTKQDLSKKLAVCESKLSQLGSEVDPTWTKEALELYKTEVDARYAEFRKLEQDALATNASRQSALKTNAQREKQTASTLVASEEALAKIQELQLQLGEWTAYPEASVQQELSQLQSRQAEISSLRLLALKLEGDLQALSASLEKASASLADVLQKKEKQADYVAKLAVLTDVRSWLHYQSGPHTIVTEVMRQLTPNVNYFLRKMEAPFSVEPDFDTVGFLYTMNNGSAMPEVPPAAKALSGAQRAMLAIAFRLASYCMFASKLGLLVLDEPTAHMDQNNVVKTGELLARVQEMAKEMDLQVVIVTHHQEILPFCDKTIRI